MIGSCSKYQLSKDQAMKRRDFLKVTGGAAVGGMAFAGPFDDWVNAAEARTTDIRNLFQNYWDFQDRWNKDAPEHARDMITVAIKAQNLNP
jgi:hypothetical protein